MPIKPARLAHLLILFAVLVFAPVLAWAAVDPTAADPDIGALFAAVIDGRWGWLTGVALVALVEPVKRLLQRYAPKASDVIGIGLAFLVAAATGAIAALVSHAPWNLSLVAAILRNAVVSIGGYTAIKRVAAAHFPGLFAPMPKPTKPPTDAIAVVPAGGDRIGPAA